MTAIEVPAAARRRTQTRTTRPTRRRRVPAGVIVMAVLFVCWLTGWLLAHL